MNKLKFKFLRAPRSPRNGQPTSPRSQTPISPRNLLSPRRFLSPTNDNRLTTNEPKRPDQDDNCLPSTETNNVENDTIQAVYQSLSSHSSRDSTDSATIDSNVRDNGPIDCDTVRKYRHRKVRTNLGGRVINNGTMGSTAVPRMPQIVESPMSYNTNHTIPTINDEILPVQASAELPPPTTQDGNLGLSLLRSKMPSFKRIRSQSNPNIFAAFDLASENGNTEDIATTNSDLDPHTAANVAQVMVSASQVSVESSASVKTERNDHPTSTLTSSTSSLSASTVKTDVNDHPTTSMLKYMAPSCSASAETQESNFINGSNVVYSNPLAATDCNNSKTNNNTEDKYSPSSVLCELFDSVYPVEIDPEGTSCDDSSVDHHYGSNILLPDMMDKTARSRSGTHDSIHSIAEDLLYETTVLCTSGQDAPYSADDSEIVEDKDSKCPKKKGSNKSSNSPHHKEFLELKKVEEKNEFKMVIALKQNSTTAPSTLASFSRSSSSEGNMDKYVNKLELIDNLAKVVNTDKEVVQPAEIPDVIVRSRSTSPTESVAFPEDSVMPSNLPSEQDYERVQDSLSTDSDNESYMSLESIGDISICDETKRLLNAHTLYADDAKTNSNHPARQKKSVLRVGSIFKSLENNNSNSDDCSLSMSAAAPSITTFSRTMRLLGATDEGSDDSSIKTNRNNTANDAARSRQHRLSWYDDEENWNKPFTLRTDATFDASMSTSSSLRSKPSTMSEYNVMDQFIGDFINGLCASRGDVDFDIDEQEEI